MERVVITNPMIGICWMQVCVDKDATDDEILDVCNSQNPSGTTNGWGRVIRSMEDGDPENILPVQCADDPNRLHIIVSC